jgi:hypothetical protein
LSAALVASLLATLAAPAALASIIATSAGPLAPGTTSTGTATIVLTETAKAALATTGTLTATITDSAAAATVTWTGTPVVSAPDSLGATVTLAGNALIIKITGHDDANIESISISGLKIKATSAAATGDVLLTWTDSAGNAIYNAFAAPTTVTGTLVSPVGSGISAGVQVKDVTGCGFSTAAAVTFNTNGPDLRTPTFVGPLSSGQQVIDFPAGTAAHLIGETIKSDVPQCPITVATIKAAAKVTYDTTTVYPGEANSPAGTIYLAEPAAPVGFLAKDTVITYTIATAGVVFSMAPSAITAGNGLTVGTPTLSADRKVVTVKVTAASTSASQVWLQGIQYDIAASVPGGTFIDVNVSLSSGLITGNPAENAVVFRGITATATTPTVYIGENNQATGLVTMTEAAAGFFQSGTGSNNVIAVCSTGVDYSFTFAPWAKVTSGDLRLRDGSTASTTNIVQGTLNGGCYTWTVWTASTTASTIVIGNSTFSSGPLINVDTDQAPGLVMLNIYSGDGTNYTSGRIATVGFAIAVFRNQVAVSALSQPTIPAGANSKAGSIQISETANGQLKRWEAICVEIMPRGSLGAIQAKYDTYIHALTTAQLPVVTATGGLLVGPVELSDESCSNFQDGGGSLPPIFGGTSSGTQALSFSFDVYQQSTSGAGKLVIDNINLITLADAANGPVLMNVFGIGGSPTNVEFQATVSNAKIGPQSSMSTDTGLSRSGPFTSGTKALATGKTIVVRVRTNPVLAGQALTLWVAKKSASGAWGAYAAKGTVTTDVNGTAYASYRSNSKGLFAFKFTYTSGGTKVGSTMIMVRWK